MIKYPFFLFAFLPFLQASPEGEPSNLTENPAMEGNGLRFHQHSFEGWSFSQNDNSSQEMTIFKIVFRGLPDQVTVYPSENYYFWELPIDGKDLQGNIRIPPEFQEKGLLSFGYVAHDQSPKKHNHPKIFFRNIGPRDGLQVQEISPLAFQVTFQDKSVIFKLNPLDQSPPEGLLLRKDEVFVERTLDESGYPFCLVFDTSRNAFVWLLDESRKVPDSLLYWSDNLLFGQRTGFVFWVDPLATPRRVLIGVSQNEVVTNSYYDGPFDQLADNHAKEIGIKEYLELAYPQHKGKLDDYGSYTLGRRQFRVAPVTYAHYETLAGFLETTEKRLSEEPDSLVELTREPDSED